MRGLIALALLALLALPSAALAGAPVSLRPDPADADGVVTLGDLFEDPERLVVFHAGENDVPYFRRQYGFGFGRLFDPYLAAHYFRQYTPLDQALAPADLDQLARRFMAREHLEPSALSEAAQAYLKLERKLHRQYGDEA